MPASSASTGPSVSTAAPSSAIPSPTVREQGAALVLEDARPDAAVEVFDSPADWGTRPLVSKDGVVPAAASGPVQNGSVYELGSIPTGTHLRRIAVPADATVVRGSPSHHVYVATKKTLAFAGHPPERMPLAGLHTNMGCASRREGTLLIIATFGEWDSRVEGAATLRLLVRVPNDVTIERAKNLSGRASLAAHPSKQEAAAAARVGYWYAPTLPTEGWERVKTTPDPRHLLDTGRGP